ncbi:Pc21g15130 [Penicillium rubens Wisconsin 54-1255]|uniref:Pc21g15130 protein n=1 Tax=Penicillium rubens (strain ATCC 28089 / DSM 1075 / NRRL 1951 / Wisconsin 54-1255) TaxID=500485 RepID=B6HJ26_PENRW|nr:Pc21g15130 [Penicillium rubens Wisconsin 54-1255]
MALKSPKSGNSTECHYWGYSFHWTDLHSSADNLKSLIYTCDSLADECVERLNKIPSDDGADKRPFKKDLYGLLRDHAEEDPKLNELWTEINTVPEWVDWDQIQRGQDVFFRYGLPILNVHILQVNSSAEAMKPGGEGHISSVRVRLLHSSVRKRILSLVEQNPQYYDVNKYGTPVNDLDCIGTINTFCSSVVWLGLPRQGIYPSQQETDDYIALWRLVAYYMGTPTDPFENTAKARAMMESLLISEIDPTETGKVLAKNIIIGLENTAPAFASKEFMEAMSRLLNGDQLADELDIPRSNLYYRMLIWGYCFWVMAISYIVPRIQFFDRIMISVRKTGRLLRILSDEEFYQLRRKYFYKLILDEKMGLGEESRFEFKYVPTLTRTTRLGQRRSTKFERPGIESLARLGLLAAVTAVATFGMGFVFAARMIPSQLFMVRA